MKPRLKTMLGFCLVLLALLAPLTWGASGGQDISISATVNPQQAAVGENLQLVVTVEGKVNLNGDPQLPDLPDFQVYNGGRSSNFSFVNGQIYSSLSFTYVLVPKHSGIFTINPITIVYGKQTYSTQPLTVTIGNAGHGGGAAPAQPQAAAPQPGNANPAPQAPSGHENEALFITTSWTTMRSMSINPSP